MEREPGSMDRAVSPNGRQRRFRMVPVRYLLPNMITLLALCSGVTAIRFAFEERYELAVACVMLAVILDAVDGRLARFLKGTSRFGAGCAGTKPGLGVRPMYEGTEGTWRY